MENLPDHLDCVRVLNDLGDPIGREIISSGDPVLRLAGDRLARLWLSRPAAVRNDELRAREMRYSGIGFRRAAVTMAEALGGTLGARPWVQPVVVVWGTLKHETREEGRVVYVQGENLVPWLQAQPGRLTNERCESVAAAVARLRADSTATT